MGKMEEACDKAYSYGSVLNGRRNIRFQRGQNDKVFSCMMSRARCKVNGQGPKHHVNEIDWSVQTRTLPLGVFHPQS